MVHLLLVEDNPADALYLRTMLDVRYPRRYQTSLAETLSDACAALRDGHFDIVLLDLSLPDSQGLDTIAGIANAAPSVPVVVLTGVEDEAVAMEAVSSGSQDYLIKGQVDGATIARAIRYACDRKRTEEALRLTQFAVDHAVDAIFWTDPRGRLQYVNITACERLGYEGEELVGTRICDLEPAMSPERWATHWERLRESQGAVYETEHLAKDGRRIPVEVTANYLSFAGREYCCVSARDLTERKRAEESLRLAQQWVYEQEQRQRCSQTY